MFDEVVEDADRRTETLQIRVTKKEKEFLASMAVKYQMSMSKIISRWLSVMMKEAN